MKNKIVSLLLAFGLITNVALANSAKLGYTSDFFYRGEQKAQESVQGSINLKAKVLGLNGSAHVCTNQSVDTGSDSYNMGLGLSHSFDLLTVYGGFHHFEDVPGDALSEIELKLSIDSFGSPSISVFRNTDDDLYTLEGAVSHSMDFDLASLTLVGSAGNTELTDSSDRSYYSIGADLSKSISDNATLSGGVDIMDADDIDREFVFGTALTFNF